MRFESGDFPAMLDKTLQVSGFHEEVELIPTAAELAGVLPAELKPAVSSISRPRIFVLMDVATSACFPACR